MRILVLTNKPPLTTRLTGGAQRTDLLLRALAPHGEVDLLIVGPVGLCDAEEREWLRAHHRVIGHSEWTTALWAGPWRFAAGWLPGLPGRAAEALTLQARRYGREAALAARVRPLVAAGRYDVIVARPLEPLLRSGLLDLGLPIVLDVDDLESEVLRQSYAAGAQPVPRALESLLVRRLRTIERRAFAACRHVWLASEEDHRQLALPHASLLPNVPWFPADRPAPVPHPTRDGDTVLLFVGNLAYEPNADGVTAFLADAWPRIRAVVPSAVLRLAGPLPPPAVAHAWRASPGVELMGFVADLAPLYDAAALTIAPLTWGGGTAIKVLESLAYARPCVLTARTLHGFQSFLHDRESVWSAPSVAAMADGCIQLLRDPTGRRAMGERGRAAVAEHASIRRFSDVVSRTLAAVDATLATLDAKRTAVDPTVRGERPSPQRNA